MANKRTIITEYFGPGRRQQPTKRNRACNPDRALRFAVLHLLNDTYGAVTAVIHDEATGRTLHTIRRNFSVKHTASINVF